MTDISYANIALYDGVTWWTPEKPLLQGTTLVRLLNEGVLKSKSIHIDHLKKYQKIRIFNAMISWVSALEIDVDCIRR